MQNTNQLYWRSSRAGAILGAIVGCAIGAATGALTATSAGLVAGAILGAAIGLPSGALIGAAAARTAGTRGGVSIGAYTGMGLGALLGALYGSLAFDLTQPIALLQQTSVLDALTQGRFEAGVLGGFLVAVLGTAVGAWVGGHNLAQRPRDLE